MTSQSLGISASLLLLTTTLHASAAAAADAAAGKKLFQQQCTICHTAEPNDNGGAQGPSLAGVFNRRAAADPAFSYTQALRGSKLTWDARTLDRFLAAPGKLVPGTAMAVAITDKAQRANVTAYLRSVGGSAAAGEPAVSAKSASKTKKRIWW